MLTIDHLIDFWLLYICTYDDNFCNKVFREPNWYLITKILLARKFSQRFQSRLTQNSHHEITSMTSYCILYDYQIMCILEFWIKKPETIVQFANTGHRRDFWLCFWSTGTLWNWNSLTNGSSKNSSSLFKTFNIDIGCSDSL